MWIEFQKYVSSKYLHVNVILLQNNVPKYEGSELKLSPPTFPLKYLLLIRMLIHFLCSELSGN